MPSSAFRDRMLLIFNTDFNRSCDPYVDVFYDEKGYRF